MHGYINKKIISVYRVFFSLLNLILVYRYFQYFDLVWPGIDNDTAIFFLNGLLVMLAITSLMLLIGLGGRVVGVCQLLISAFIMRDYSGGIFELIHLLCSWVFVAVRVDADYSVNNILLRKDHPLACKYEKSSNTWLFVISFYFGLIFLYIGIDKLLDPLWQRGTGFHAFTNLPWTLPDYMKWISNVKWFVFLTNYLTIIIEIGFVFLFVFRKTRIYGLALVAVLFLGLIWPFNIYLIGWYSAALCIAMFSLCFGEETKTNFSTVPIVVMSVLTICVGASMYSSFIQRHDGSNTVAKFDSIHSVQLPLNAKNKGNFKWYLWNRFHLNEILHPVSFVNNWFVRVQRVGLFSSRHLIGLYAYRVILTMKDGSIIEPVKYFNTDKTRGDVSSEYATLNIFNNGMYYISDLSNRLSNHAIPFNCTSVYPFIEYPVSKVESKSVLYASLIVSKMTTEKSQWVEIIRYSSEGYSLVSLPEKHDVQARQPDLDNYFLKR